MTRTSVTGTLPLPPGQAWDLLSDLSRFGDWLTIHGGWVGEPPPPAVGVRVSEHLLAMGLAVDVDWTIEVFEPPRELRIAGVALAGSRIDLTMSVTADGEESRVAVTVELAGQLMTGPIGAAVEQSLRGELEKSLIRLQDLAEAARA